MVSLWKPKRGKVWFKKNSDEDLGKEKMDTRVGHATTTHLERMSKERLVSAWKQKDYPTFNEYAVKYKRLKAYNQGDEE